MIAGRRRDRNLSPVFRGSPRRQDARQRWRAGLALLGGACSRSESWDADSAVPPTPTTQRKSSSTADPVIAAAGDIARSDCLGCSDLYTAILVNEINPTVVLALGDTQYETGALKDYLTGYDNTWGWFKNKTKPVPGDNEYLTPGARGYFRYFGRAARPKGKSYYSFDLGSWHLVALDSNIHRGPGSAQERWLKADLAQNSKRCVLAYWHLPRYSSHLGKTGDRSVEAFWVDLYAVKADIVLNGHWHHYERFALQNPSGAQDPKHGIRQFIVGTGGAPLLGPPRARLATSQKLFSQTHGVLKIDLHPKRYSWQFIDVRGLVRDSGSQACH
jgi:hypothetical protein